MLYHLQGEKNDLKKWFINIQMTSECLLDLIKYLKCYQGISNITKVSYLNCELNKHLILKNTLYVTE